MFEIFKLFREIWGYKIHRQNISVCVLISLTKETLSITIASVAELVHLLIIPDLNYEPVINTWLPFPVQPLVL